MQKPFAGRAGEKLEHALTEFHIDVSGKVCADFGSSVGGFVDCLLRHSATKVYAIETGYGVLDWKLRNNSKVIVMERTNAMHIVLPEKVDIATVDTSWTKQQYVIPNVLKQVKENGIIISLIKPHYEADKKLLRGGKLAEDVAEIVAKQTIQQLETIGVVVKGFTKSPLTGTKGKNTEFLALLQKI